MSLCPPSTEQDMIMVLCFVSPPATLLADDATFNLIKVILVKSGQKRKQDCNGQLDLLSGPS